MILWEDTTPISYSKIFAPKLRLGRDNSQIVYNIAPVYMFMCTPENMQKRNHPAIQSPRAFYLNHSW